MKKMLVAISAALLSLSLAAVVPAATPEAPAQGETGKPVHEFKSLVRSYRLLGKVVKGAKKENLGRITQILLDPKTGQAVYVLVTSGGVLDIAEQKRLVPWEALQIDPKTYAVSLALTARQFNQAPTGTVVSTRQQAEEIYRYYGVATPWEQKSAP